MLENAHLKSQMTVFLQHHCVVAKCFHVTDGNLVRCEITPCQIAGSQNTCYHQSVVIELVGEISQPVSAARHLKSFVNNLRRRLCVINEVQRV